MRDSVPIARVIPAFVRYCFNGTSIESTNSLIINHVFARFNITKSSLSLFDARHENSRGSSRLQATRLLLPSKVT